MSMTFKHTAVAAALAVAFVAPVEAATVTFGPTPTAAFANPLADAGGITGTVFENVVGSIGGVRRSPWQGSTVDENAATSFYTSVSAGSSATYTFASLRSSLSFLWGSPDDYNDLDIILSGGGGTVTVNGTQAQGPVAIGAQFVTISGVGMFDTVTFRSGRANAFEYANLTAVPLPAGGLLLLTALGGLAVARRRKNA